MVNFCSYLCLLVSYHLVMVFFCYSIYGASSLMVSFCLFDFFGLNLSLELLMDLFSCMFSGSVALITMVVVSYSYYYMGEGANMTRFYVLLLLFVFSMFILVHSLNLIFIMIGWDGLGLTSFCLIIYYGGASVQRSGLVSIYLNRVGDMGLVICIFFLIDLGIESGGVSWLMESPLFFILFSFSCITKSAQYPFSSWLPAAMSAPTPISSLVHSSTLVTAGVYLLIRFYPVFFDFYSSFMFSFLSLFTMVGAGTIAVLERDLKKVIAMSTLSQLGLMVFILSMGEANYCFFHLIAHAYFKSLLFMSCGGLLLSVSGNQDYRFKSNSMILSPLFSFYFSSCSLSLGGLTFLSGFFSKDLCLDSIYESNSGVLFTYMFYLGCLLTLLYSIQLFMDGLSSSSFLGSSIGAETGYLFCFLQFFLFVLAVVFGKMSFFVFFVDEFDFSFSFMKSLGLLFFLGSFILLYFMSLYSSFLSFKDFMMKIFFLDYFFGVCLSKSSVKNEMVSFLDLTWVELLSVKHYYESLMEFGGKLFSFFSLSASPKSIIMFAVYILVLILFSF